MNANKLKGKIVEKGLNVEKVAELIGIDKSTFYRKLNNFDSFTIKNAVDIKNALGLSSEEATEIFLS